MLTLKVQDKKNINNSIYYLTTSKYCTSLIDLSFNIKYLKLLTPLKRVKVSNISTEIVLYFMHFSNFDTPKTVKQKWTKKQIKNPNIMKNINIIETYVSAFSLSKIFDMFQFFAYNVVPYLEESFFLPSNNDNGSWQQFWQIDRCMSFWSLEPIERIDLFRKSTYVNLNFQIICRNGNMLNMCRFLFQIINNSKRQTKKLNY